MNIKKHKHKHIIFVISILLGLTILFLWKERLTLRSSINDQKVTNFFITAFTAIGTLATILYTIRQYKLSALGQRTAIKPEIYPLTCRLKMEDSEETLDIEGIESGLYLAHAHSFEHTQKLFIKNLGVGLAKNISASWIFDKDEVESLIKGIYYITPEDKQKLIPFLPSNDSAEINYPSSYLSCCGSRLFTDLEHKYFTNTSELDSPLPPKNFEAQFLKWKEETFGKKRPPLKIRIRYSDIQDHEYIKDFDAQVTGILNLVTINFYTA